MGHAGNDRRRPFRRCDQRPRVHGAGLYRELGLASVSCECLDIQDLTDAITLVKVRCLFHDTDGYQLTHSTAYYIVRRDDDGLHARVCVQTDDAENLHSLAAERGIDLAKFTRS